MNHTGSTQPIGGHLVDLRRMLLRVVIAIGVTSIAVFAFAPALFRFLQAPYLKVLARHDPTLTTTVLQTLEPAETFKLSFSIAIVCALALMLPYLLYELWRFARSGLYDTERRWLLPLLIGGTTLFALGAAFAYCAVLPLLLAFFWEYSLRLGVTPVWSIGKYIHFVLGTVVAFGLAFELPVVTTVLAGLGLIRPAQMRGARRVVMFGICVTSALLTPADVVSMILMAIPLIFLYELAILVAGWIAPHNTREEKRDVM
jgi:sec-independent protein translocase protein TatC